MPEPVTIGDVTLLAGDVREVLRSLPAESVQCCITSPPYWGLRAYGTAPQVWGGRADCEHEWGNERRTSGPKKWDTSTGNTYPNQTTALNISQGAFCQRCGAWRGELGNEPTPALFVEHLLVVNPISYKGAHFATFPPKLVEPMIKAGTSEKGCCPKCGKPWRRAVESVFVQEGPTRNRGKVKSGDNDAKSVTMGDGGKVGHNETRTLGWRPACRCNAGEPVPCVVCDIFSGAGTTCMVAAQLGRRAIGIDLKDEYNQMAAARIGKALSPATFVDKDATVDLPLLAQTKGDE